MADEKTWLTEATTTEPENELAEETARPRTTPFRQQRIKCCGEIPHYDDEAYEDEACEWTSCRVGCVFFVTGVACLLLGILLLLDDDIEVIHHRYDDIDTSDNVVVVKIDVEKDMPFPLRLGFSLTEFYQNARRNVGSRSEGQLRGTDLLDDIDKCKPTEKLESTILPGNGKVIYPCGLTSQSIFTDRFTVKVSRGSEAFELCPTYPTGLCPDTMDEVINHPNGTDFWDMFEHPGSYEKDGAWDDDVGYKYRLPEDPGQLSEVTRNSAMLTNNLQDAGLRAKGLQLPDVTDVDLMVWMRIPVRDSWKKPHRIIRSFRDWSGLKKGDTLQVKVFKLFHGIEGGERNVFIETTPRFGDSKSFLVALFLVTGGCATLFFLFTILPVFSEGKFHLQLSAPPMSDH